MSSKTERRNRVVQTTKTGSMLSGLTTLPSTLEAESISRTNGFSTTRVETYVSVNIARSIGAAIGADAARGVNIYCNDELWSMVPQESALKALKVWYVNDTYPGLGLSEKQFAYLDRLQPDTGWIKVEALPLADWLEENLGKDIARDYRKAKAAAPTRAKRLAEENKAQAERIAFLEAALAKQAAEDAEETVTIS